MSEIRIDDEENLLRRLGIDHFVEGSRISSAAYKRNGVPENQASVDLERLTTLQESVDRAGRSGFILARVIAKWPRSLDLDIVHIPENGNYAHCEIRGQNTKEKCKELARRSRLVCGVTSAGTVFEFSDMCEEP